MSFLKRAEPVTFVRSPTFTKRISELSVNGSSPDRRKYWSGFAGVREVLPIPYALSVVLVLGGVLAFFFGPRLLVKRWKARESAED